MVLPPSTMIVCPVRKDAASLARKNGGARHLHELSDPTKRGIARQCLQRFRIFPQRPGEVGSDQTWRDAIDAHSRRAEFGGKVAHDLDIRRLRDIIAPMTVEADSPPIDETTMMEPVLRSTISGAAAWISQ